MGFVRIPVIPRTIRPSVVGTPVWYAEATQARTQLDISITIPAGSSRKLILLWGSDGGEFPSAVTFDPAGAAFPMIPIDGAVGSIGNLRVAAYYLDTPPTGSKVVRFTTANAVWSVASLKVFQNARAGLPVGAEVAATGTSVGIALGQEGELIDAFSETPDLVLGDGLSDGDLTPLEGQVAGADDVVNASFLATGSDRTHGHNGEVQHGWSAAAEADLLTAAVNVLFSTGQVVGSTGSVLSRWNLDETGTSYADEQGRSNAALVSGNASGGHSPLFSGGGASVSLSSAKIDAAHHVDWQVRSYSWSVYCQPRAWPAGGTNDAILSKDSGLPVPGGFQVEVEDDGKIDWYIRDETGLAGTGIHVTPTEGAGTLTLDVAHLLVGTYDDDTKTAKLYHRQAGGSVTLLVSTTDASFAGLENNASAMSLFSRQTTSGNELDGIGDQLTFYSGVLTQSEIDALPAPTTITDPLAPGGITAVDDNVGNVSPSTTTDVDVLANDTGKTGPHYRITEVSDPSGRMSIINNDSATAQVRLTMPAAPSATTNESGSYNVREGTSPTFGNPSNEATVTWTRQGTGGGGGYTPFPFVTNNHPSIVHTGVTNRPGFSASDPRSASFIDPVSKLEVFRVGGNNGANVMINGVTDSGLNYPRRLRNQNNTKTAQDWNSDGTLLMVSRRYEVTGDASNAASSYILDCDGSHGASVPWRVIRVGSNRELGDSSVGAFWFWDHLNPLRAYAIRSNNIAEWWPIGGNGHGVGEVNTLFGLPSGFNYTDIARYGLYSSIDGVWHHLQCRRNSDGKRGGMRVNLHTGATNSFVPNPFQNADHSDRAVEATLPLGLYGAFTPVDLPAPNFNWRRFVNMTNGQEVSNQDNSSSEITHVDSVYVDGKEYYAGQDDGIRLWDVVSGGWSARGNFPGGNPEHIGCRNQEDTFENYGATGGSTMGQRYVIWVRSNTERLIWGIRIGKNDFNVSRVIAAHRSIRTTNANEVHPKPDRKMEKLVFNSNWHEPGVVSDGDVHPYVVIIPDAWRSPNNDGS
jgi:hypothetical protein